ncbi:MAG: NUDIX hydrolase [bacterium]
MVNQNKATRLRVAAFILNSKNELLLVKHEKNGRSYWLLPGGGVEFGESLKQALKRELKEELSIEKCKLENIVFVNDTLYPDKSRHILNINFRVRVAGSGSFKVKPDRVLKTAEFINKEKFKKILFYPGIKKNIIKMWETKFMKNEGYVRTSFKP